MKEIIEYYYQMKIDDFKEDSLNNSFSFNYEGYYYCFYYSFFNDKDINEINRCVKELSLYNILYYQFVSNINDSFLTKINDVNYVLIKGDNPFDIVNFDDILLKTKKVLNTKSFLNHSDWAKLWSYKMDYFEEQLNEINHKKIIYNSIDYYIGLCENAIYYVNNVKKKYFGYDNLVLSHRRLSFPCYNKDYKNPLNIVFDYEVRDVAEYIKYLFWSEEDAFLELQTYLKIKKLSIFLYNMLFARLLFPSYYFDVYEKIINNNVGEEVLNKFIDNSSKYEEFLKKAYLEISKYAPLEDIRYLL